MHIFLFILSRIGLVLLGILGLILFILVLVLFVPIRYKGEGNATGLDVNGSARVSWLLRVVSFKIEYIDKKPAFELYLFGIPIFKLLDKRRKKKEEKLAREKAEKKRKKQTERLKDGGPPYVTEKKEASAETGQSPEKQDNKQTLEISGEAELNHDMPEGEEKPSAAELLVEKVAEVIAKAWLLFEKLVFRIMWLFGRILYYITIVPQRIFGAVTKALRKAGDIWSKIEEGYALISSEMFKVAFRCVRKEVWKILKHIMPGRIRGKVVYGFSDPATTGQVLGMSAMLYPWTHGKVEVLADFEQTRFEADLCLKGRIQIFVLLLHGVKILLNKQVRKLIKVIRNKGE